MAAKLLRPLEQDAKLIADVADLIREARSAEPWSTHNLPGQDVELALRILMLVDVWKAARAMLGGKTLEEIKRTTCVRRGCDNPPVAPGDLCIVHGA